MNTKTAQREGERSRVSLLILIALVFFSIIPFVSAQNMSMTTLNYLTSQDVNIYVANGTYLGTWNTTSAYIPLPAQDFQIVITPTGVDRFTDPSTLLTDSFDFIENNFIAMLVIGAFIGLASGRLW